MITVWGFILTFYSNFVLEFFLLPCWSELLDSFGQLEGGGGIIDQWEAVTCDRREKVMWHWHLDTEEKASIPAAAALSDHGRGCACHAVPQAAVTHHLWWSVLVMASNYICLVKYKFLIHYITITDNPLLCFSPSQIWICQKLVTCYKEMDIDTLQHQWFEFMLKGTRGKHW